MKPSHFRFGVQFRNFPSGLRSSVLERMEEVARECERLHFNSLWMIDHLLMRPPIAYESQPVPECWTALAFLAEKTRRISLGSLVSCVLFRDKSYLARVCYTLNEIAEGRLKIGLGSGWFDDEFRSYSIPFPDAKVRVSNLKATALYIKEFFKSMNNSSSYLKSAESKASPMLWLGGSGEKLTLRAVAECADACSLFRDPSSIARKNAILDSYCAAIGRNPSEITRSKHSNVIIGKDELDVTRKLSKIVPQESKWKQFAESNIVGTPDQCLAQVKKYTSTGISYLTLSFPDVFDMECLRLFDELIVQTNNPEIIAPNVSKAD